MKNRIVYFIGFWLLYLVIDSYFEFLVSYGESSMFTRIYQSVTGVLVSLIPKVGLGYFLVYIFIRREFPKRYSAWVNMLIVVAAVLCALVIFRLLFYYYVTPVIYARPKPLRPLFDFYVLNVNFFDMIGPVAILMILEYYHISQKAKESALLFEREKIISELKFLKSQINPHFLFNTLNNIYSLARKQAPQTPDVVMRLSKLLRFMLYESERRTISISEEVKVLEDYTELERIRHGNKLDLVFNKDIDDPDMQIAPLILLPFIENAFKHGAGESRHQAFIYIQLSVKRGKLVFHVQNSSESTEKEPEAMNGIGLQNVQRQLALIYPAHRLEIARQPNCFDIKLELNLM